MFTPIDFNTWPRREVEHAPVPYCHVYYRLTVGYNIHPVAGFVKRRFGCLFIP